ncbi:MAG: ATP-binding protein [Verrucomicrobiales bacterium]|nr:ATP-binding protein [Verrucomicrobiales bacterium]
MKTTPPVHAFLRQAGRLLNSGQSRTLLLTGNIHDLFGLQVDARRDYLPLLPFLSAHWALPDVILVVYELNGPIQFVREGDEAKVRDAWFRWRTGKSADELAVQRMLAKGREAAELDQVVRAFDDSLRGAINNPTLALELLRQLCVCARATSNGRRNLGERLILLVEGADLLIPEAPVHSLSDTDRQRVAICHDWFSDPAFVHGADSVVLVVESRSLLNQRLARLPQALEIEIPAPDLEARAGFIDWFLESAGPDSAVKLWGTPDDLARLTAGLSLHALMQLLKGARHEQRVLQQIEVIGKVEDFIRSQLGDDVVEFKKPTHSFADVIGFQRLKSFLRDELMARFNAGPAEAITGAAVCGPIGGGKTFVFEAFAAELDIVVLTLKNLRSQWFGQTDVIFERLRRLLHALARVLIFIDEADTQFGGVGADAHETERRLTGKLQAMMSDPPLRGRVFWLLITARIHRLSPDLRRPGRVGDLIIPALDPEGEDRQDFLRWAVAGSLAEPPNPDQMTRLEALTRGYSAAAFASLRAQLRARSRRSGKALTFDEVVALISDMLSPAIEDTRRYQTLQALVNCTRRTLLPDPTVTDAQRQAWTTELRALEAKGIQ